MEILKADMTCRKDGCKLEHPSTLIGISALISDSFNKGVEEERAICRQIYIGEVDWAEWAMSDEEAGEEFDEARANLSQLKDNK